MIGIMIRLRTGGRRHQVLLMSSACRRRMLSGRCDCIGTSGCRDGRNFGNVAGLHITLHSHNLPTAPLHRADLAARQLISEVDDTVRTSIIASNIVGSYPR